MTITEKYQNITGYDVLQFIIDFSNFVNNQYQSIIDYYTGNAQTLNQEAFNELNRLINEFGTVNELSVIHVKRFDTVDFWELLDDIDTIGNKLLTIKNTSKWTRSAIANAQYSQTIQVDKTLDQNKTIENLVDEFGSDNKDTDWYKVALDNKVREEDYTPEGGNVLAMDFLNNFRFNLDTVVDNLSGQKVYGKDIQRILAYSDDDIKTLSYKETIQQSFEVLIGLQKGSVPEFTADGLNTQAIVGSNVNSISYPYIFRQLFTVFAKDDTFKSLSINKIENKDGVLNIEFQAKTRLDEVLNENLTI